MVSSLCADFYMPPFSSEHKQQNRTGTLCSKCLIYNLRGKKSQFHTTQQSTICTQRPHICQHIFPCASDNHMNAIPFFIEKYPPSRKRMKVCKTKT